MVLGGTLVALINFYFLRRKWGTAAVSFTQDLLGSLNKKKQENPDPTYSEPLFLPANILSSSLIFQISHTVCRERVHNEIFFCGIFPGFHLDMAFLFLFSQKDSPFPRPHKSFSDGEMGQLGRSVWRPTFCWIHSCCSQIAPMGGPAN